MSRSGSYGTRHFRLKHDEGAQAPGVGSDRGLGDDSPQRGDECARPRCLRRPVLGRLPERTARPPQPRFAEPIRSAKNWASVFAGVPNLVAELLTSATLGDGVEIGEWSWHGTHTDGSDFAMRGVIVAGLEDEQIDWARLYMEPVEHNGADIQQMVRETYRPPDRLG